MKPAPPVTSTRNDNASGSARSADRLIGRSLPVIEVTWGDGFGPTWVQVDDLAMRE
jgi:hypothetical protein